MKRLPVILLLLISPFAYSQWEDTDRLTADFHKGRRAALRELLPDQSAAVIFANPVRNRANDVDYQYHQDPDFYYLTGYLEPDAVLILFKNLQSTGKSETNEMLFVREKKPSAEIWTGRRLGVDSARVKLGISTVYGNSEFMYADIDFKGMKSVLVRFPLDPNKSKGEKCDLARLVAQFKSKTESAKVVEDRLGDLMAILREEKQPEELKLMQKAIDITIEGFVEMIRSVEPGFTEYQAQAIGEYYFKKNGSEYPGYGSICGGGHNGCVLHYVTNRKTLKGDDLLLMDMGAEYHGYTADITRTIPVDGHFSVEEAALYQLVYNAQEAAFEKCGPGNAFRAPHEAAYEVIAKGLVDLGIITERQSAGTYFMHGTSHYLGLDVHDAGTFGTLKANTIITVEPGIYIPEGSPCDSKWWNKGIRIEDDVLVTDRGYKILSSALPRTMEEIEMLMQQPGMTIKSVQKVD